MSKSEAEVDLKSLVTGILGFVVVMEDITDHKYSIIARFIPLYI